MSDPAYIGVAIDVPLPVIDTVLNKTADSSEIKPSSATKRALVEENNEIPSTRISGLTMKIGKDPGPPGFPINARFGPPPGSRNPESMKKRFGSTINSKLQGAQSKTGVITSAKRRYNL
jgi:hypothetical protein